MSSLPSSLRPVFLQYSVRHTKRHYSSHVTWSCLTVTCFTKYDCSLFTMPSHSKPPCVFLGVKPQFRPIALFTAACLPYHQIVNLCVKLSPILDQLLFCCIINTGYRFPYTGSSILITVQFTLQN